MNNKQHHIPISDKTQQPSFLRKYVHVASIDRVEFDSEVKRVPGTRQFHQFQAVGDNVVRARQLACFCTACREGKADKCCRSNIVGTFEVFKVAPRSAIN